MKEQRIYEGVGAFSDLAVERRRADTDLPGVRYEETAEAYYTLSRLTVTGDAGERSIGKPAGRYSTLTHPPLSALTRAEQDTVALAAGEMLGALLPRGARRLLAVGLGNRRVTADALGPRAAEAIVPTAHLARESPDLPTRLGCYEIAVCVPGVCGGTGLSALDTVLGVAERFRPDAVIAFDALAAMAPKRLFRTVQATDAGIEPGSGIGSGGEGLCRRTVGVPVIGVGVPTVMRLRAYLSLFSCGESANEEAEGLYVFPTGMDESLRLSVRLLATGVNRILGFDPDMP